jgi:hypothetical protein
LRKKEQMRQKKIGDYEIGSPEDEPSRSPGEDRPPVEITCPFAMLDRS